MTARARIAALALVNWKGVFYERYLLDRHVTALEGMNGAGKTTVMIAAYVALLPDLSKLRFTNLGETAATGGDRGIWGRLGEAGRPAYTVLDLVGGEGERVLAGVRLVRQTEPTIEPTAFLVTGLGPDVRLSDILLVRRLDGDHIPELDEIKRAAEAAGGALVQFRAIKDYFAELFERGITPMRLAADEERGKLNEMLRTSMTGGISRALTSELRGFLLKEETGLGDTLARMRANLDACARTRSEVRESRQLEREISAIYEAGTEMFSATVHAARAAAHDVEREAVEARRVVDDGARARRELAEAGAQVEARIVEVAARLAAAQAAHGAAVAAAARREQARAVAARLADLEAELATLADADAGARARQVAATAERAAARAERTRATEAYDRAAHGLADLQAGIDELVRRAHGHRQLVRRLADARRLTGRADLAPESAGAAIADLDREREQREAERARLERDARDLAARRAEHARALAALGDLRPARGLRTPDSGLPRGTDIAGDGLDLHAEARAALARLRELEAIRDRAPHLAAERQVALQLADRQLRARGLAERFGIAVTATSTPATSTSGAGIAVTATSTPATSTSGAGIAATSTSGAGIAATSTSTSGAGIVSTSASDAVVAALADTESAVRELERAGDARQAAARERRGREAELRARLATADDRAARWHVAGATASRLAAAGPIPESRADLVALRDRLALELHGLGAERARIEASRAELQQRAALVEQSGTSLDPELLRLRDELGGELLASRFEDLDLAAASWVEARLGPLVGALVVDDLDAAVAAAVDRDRAAASVYLVRAGTELAIAPPDNVRDLGDAADVVAPEAFGARVTRTRPRPSLGRRARERAVRELHDAIARDGAALDEVAERERLVAAWRRDAELLDRHFDALAAGDPTAEPAAIATELAALALADADDDRAAAAAREATAAARARLDGLRRLLPDVGLLDPPDHAARARDLAAQQVELAAITEELVRVAPARAVLGDLVDALRSPPPDDSAIAERTTRAAELAARLDELAAARAALEDVLAHRHAANHADAEAALDARTTLTPALEAQHAEARAAVTAAAEAESTHEAAWETATAAAQRTEAARLAAVAHRDRAAAELAAFADILPTPIASSTATSPSAATPRSPSTTASMPPAREPDPEALAARVAELDRESRELATARALAAEREDRAGRAADDARARLAALTREAGPTVATWTALRDSAQADGLLHAALAGPAPTRTSIQLAADAWSKRELLTDRVARARGGDELATALRDAPLDPAGYFAAWRATRDWLRRRVPAQVADVDEPMLALERLRDHLDVLEGRLARQEHDLRGASEDVARGIDVQVRRAHGQVRRLNTQLDGIRFGSIAGIRVEVRRIDRMEQILRALRVGEAQELLFLSAMPIEEALDEIFRRYGGGGRAGGQRLLDYREYLELGVEIRRQAPKAGDATWETASPTKLSTGEAIGVGAALMMVVLTEWERDANLLRARRTAGSLRFLFLDEANRLSRDNLGVLFDLCRTLDLQLLIAAPEVARAEGNTTYRLVRHVTDDGREEVIVSGRRSIDPPPPELTSAS